MSQQELAARCFVAKSGVSMLLTQMEGKGLVVREADHTDARVWRLSLTAEGIALADRCMKVQSDVISIMVADATEVELATVTKVMERMSDRLETLRAAPVAKAAAAMRGRR